MLAAEFGDFQTPAPLARQVVDAIQRFGADPHSVLEPTVGTGTLLAACLHAFPRCDQALGFDIHAPYLQRARANVRALLTRVVLRQANVFSLNFAEVVASLPAPVLIIGNPPWVTSSRQGALRSCNLPAKSNFEGRRGIDAITGQANFDVSEWIIVRLLQALEGTGGGVLAMLCKTRVARRVLLQATRGSLGIEQASLFAVDAAAHFGAAVDACLLLCRSGTRSTKLSCLWHDTIDAHSASRTLLFTDGVEIADAHAFSRVRALYRPGAVRWRSGVKHDCARVMEFELRGDALYNGADERVDLEPDHVLPLLKGADLIQGHLRPQRFMLVPQRSPGEDPARLQSLAPRTWQYLLTHAPALDARASKVFRSRPAFSIFGVGDYSFAPWKLAVPALHKRLVIRAVGPHRDRPVVFDDTCYLLPCRDELHARVLQALMRSPRAQALLQSLVFWADKRPIRVDALGSVDLPRLALSSRVAVHDALAGTRFSHESIDRELDAVMQSVL